MPSVFKRGETFVVQFINENKRRKTVTVGPSEKLAGQVSDKIEDLLSARKWNRGLMPETSTWLKGLPRIMQLRLERVGLLESSEPAAVMTLGQLLNDYLAKRTDAKASSKIVWGHAKRNLVDFFRQKAERLAAEAKSQKDAKAALAKRDPPITEITQGDAKDFERFLRTTARENRYGDAKKTDGLSADTIRKRCGIAKQFFADAIDRKLISENPFEKLKSTVKGNRERDFFVTREMTTKLLEACPDAQWKLIIALSRFGGLRCPSEHLRLRIDDVDWAQNRIRVWSPKTEHHEGKAYRFIPLFPELHRPLMEVAEEAPEGTEYFITRYRAAEQNLRTTFLKIIARAGLEPWPKLFHNMRASRQTELEETFPSHVVCAWIGNSPQVAKRHYLQVTEEHFARATAEERCNFVCSDAVQSSANSASTNKKPAMECDEVHATAGGMDDEGLEIAVNSRGKSHRSPPRCNSVSSHGPEDSGDQGLTIEEWLRLCPVDLDDSLQTAIFELIQS